MDDDTLTALYADLRRWALAFPRTDPAVDADELAQRAVVRVWATAGTLDRPREYYRRTLRSVALDACRRRKFVVPATLEGRARARDDYAAVEWGALLGPVLARAERDAGIRILVRVAYGVTLEEQAAETGNPRQTYNVRAFRARQRLGGWPLAGEEG